MTMKKRNAHQARPKDIRAQALLAMIIDHQAQGPGACMTCGKTAEHLSRMRAFADMAAGANLPEPEQERLLTHLWIETVQNQQAGRFRVYLETVTCDACFAHWLDEGEFNREAVLLMAFSARLFAPHARLALMVRFVPMVGGQVQRSLIEMGLQTDLTQFVRHQNSRSFGVDHSISVDVF